MCSLSLLHRHRVRQEARGRPRVRRSVRAVGQRRRVRQQRDLDGRALRRVVSGGKVPPVEGTLGGCELMLCLWSSRAAKFRRVKGLCAGASHALSWIVSGGNAPPVEGTLGGCGLMLCFWSSRVATFHRLNGFWAGRRHHFLAPAKLHLASCRAANFRRLKLLHAGRSHAKVHSSMREATVIWVHLKGLRNLTLIVHCIHDCSKTSRALYRKRDVHMGSRIP